RARAALAQRGVGDAALVAVGPAHVQFVRRLVGRHLARNDHLRHGATSLPRPIQEGDRAMRVPDMNDVDLVLRLYDLRREREMRKARKFIFEFQPKSLDDVRAVLSFEHPENAHFRQVMSYWGMVADFVTRDLFHPEMFAAHCGESLFIYAKFEPFLPEI